MTPDEKKSLAEELLRQKYRELGRIPHKDDFDDSTRSRIKAFLGPWPRALEAAGLKAEKIKPKKTHKRKRKKSRETNSLVPHHKNESINTSSDRSYVLSEEKGE